MFDPLASHNVILSWVDPDRKIQAIKAVRLASLLFGEPFGLKDAKDAVERQALSVLFSGHEYHCHAAVAVLNQCEHVSSYVEKRSAEITLTLTHPEVVQLRGLAWGDDHMALGDKLDNALRVVR